MRLSRLLIVPILVLEMSCVVVSASDARHPFVLWHGMGDTCCSPISIGAVAKAIKKRYGTSAPDIGMAMQEQLSTLCSVDFSP
jgi:hypothetical protein